MTPAYNSAKFIAEAISSVREQSFEDWEHIIVDDCSSDRTVDIVREIERVEPRLRLIELEENSGPAVARNTAISAASGRYIAFLDSDDIWFRDKLKRQIDFMKSNEIAFSYTAYSIVDERGSKSGHRTVPESLVYSDL